MPVRQTLTNGIYAGVAQWDGVEVEGVYPAIIDKATYEASAPALRGFTNRQTSGEQDHVAIKDSKVTRISAIELIFKLYNWGLMVSYSY